MFAYAKPEQKQASKSAIQKKELSKMPAYLNQTGIPDEMKTRFENLSGFSFDDVRVHYNSDKPAQLQALAYTQGNQVYVAPGQEKHLGHELGHVVQQKAGRVQPTLKAKGININDDNSLENEADQFDSRVVQEKSNIVIENGVQISDVIQRERDGTANANFDSKNVEGLYERIIAIKNLINGHNFKEAILLLQGGFPGLTIRHNTYLTTADLENKTKENMYYPKSLLLKIALPSDEQIQESENDYNTKVLLYALEEYIHAYQDVSGTFLSDSTNDFKRSDFLESWEDGAKLPAFDFRQILGDDITHDEDEDNVSTTDYDEIDIVAILSDWGFDVRKYGFVEKYKEREPYMQWRDENGSSAFSTRSQSAPTGLFSSSEQKTKSPTDIHSSISEIPTRSSTDSTTGIPTMVFHQYTSEMQTFEQSPSTEQKGLLQKLKELFCGCC